MTGGPDLLGPDAADLLALACASAGSEVLEHSLHAVHTRPGDGTSVGFRVRVRAAGVEREDYVLLSTSRARGVDTARPGVAVLDGDAGRVLAWRFPDDPALPALARATDPVALAAALPGEGPVTAHDLVTYRPLRRAVVRAERGGVVHWVKVLRPHGRGGTSPAADVVARHGMLAAAGLPVPEVLRADPDGLVVLAAATGEGLLHSVLADEASGVAVRDLVALLDRMPPAVLDLPARPAWSDRAGAHAAALDGTAWAERARTVADEVLVRSATLDLGPVVPTHGDLHEGQLTVVGEPGDRRVTGLLDVDGLGPGHRVDDLACVVAHALALGPAGASVAARWRQEALDGGHAGAEALDVRTAGVLLSLVVGAADHGRAGGSADPGELLALAEGCLARAPQPSSR
ncbi:phosphotransferase [Arthrobacter sp. NEB 688]|uniref:phosphotransferase n=1 Tax=Arthrobacter sp. NEB 688 TaxID=904039 RepID=UPI001566D898|nr:phosphotransferase [Arthrobacter sp. NEB 688]QKE83628.1 phosphotransferase [Arthrobacter sp. NEB 688]